MATLALPDLLRRERMIIGFALAAVVGLAWAYTIWLSIIMAPSPTGAQPMDMNMPMAGMASPMLGKWTPLDFAFMASMWTAMMVGMMTPSVTPMILLYSRVGDHAISRGKDFAPPAWFAGGYLLAWTAFALLATAAQWSLESAALLSPAMATSSRYLGGIVLLGAGLYQWSPLKNACLGQCRAPLTFIQQHGGFSRHASGSLRLGLLHGAYCVGCCWALMLLLFVGGVMNLLWVAGLMGLVLLEKLFPVDRWIPRITGAALVAAGIWLLTSPA